MIRHRDAFVRSGARDVDHIHLEVVDVDAILLESPIDQGELAEDRVARHGGEIAGRHADRVPVLAVGNVELHQVTVEVRRPLGVQVKVHPPGRVADADARLDAELELRTAELLKVHPLGHVAA